MVYVSYRGKQYEFNVIDQTTIRQLKQEIENQLDVALETQKLIWEGQVLADDHLLAKLSQNGPTFLLYGKLVLRIRLPVHNGL